MLTNNQRGKWFKFNDNIVEEFEMSETTLEAECFGGTYKAKIYDQCKTILLLTICFVMYTLSLQNCFLKYTLNLKHCRKVYSSAMGDENRMDLS